MIITYHGAGFHRVTFGDTSIAFNPISKDSSLKQTRFGVDIALISLEHPDYNGVENVTHGEKIPFVARGPGEYEVKDVLIKGYPTVSDYNGTRRINTVYLVKLEKMLLLHLGALGTKELPSELKETLDSIDILFVPIGGEGVLEPSPAHELAVSIEPKVVIPSHHIGTGIKNALEIFLKEEGAENGTRTPQEKYTIKAKDIELSQNEVVVLAT